MQAGDPSSSSSKEPNAEVPERQPGLHGEGGILMHRTLGGSKVGVEWEKNEVSHVSSILQ